MVSKLGCFKLIEILYGRGTREELNAKESAINKSFCNGNPQTGKELTQEVTRAAHGTKKENCRGETIASELRRQCHCAAYNALVAIISCTQTEVKFYTGFLFTENLQKASLV